MRCQIVRATLSIAIIVFVASCATPGPGFIVDVSTLVDDRRPAGKTFAIVSGDDGVSVDDLQFHEFAGYLRGALVRRGYVEGAVPANADLAIAMRYGIGEPRKETYSYSLPVYGETGGGTATVNMTNLDLGTGETSTTTGRMRMPTTYDQVGTTTRTATVTTYHRFLALDALDLAAFRATKEVRPVWRTTVSSTGSSGDLRLVFPILVAAAEPHLGVNTKKVVNVTLTESDPRVIAVRGEK